MRYTAREVDELLMPIALERARAIGPFVVFVVAAALVTSEPLGIPIATPVLIWNVIGITATALLVAGLRMRRIPARWGHLSLAMLWVVATGGTLVSQYFSHVPGLALLAFVEVVAAAIMLDIRYVLTLFLVFDCAWIPINAISGDRSFGLYAVTMGCAQVFAVIFHRLQRVALLEMDALRRDQQRTSDELASQLTELRRSEDERRRLQDELLHAQRMDAIGTLASGLAHDMNNVLASITSLAEIVREDPSAPTTSDDLDSLLAQTGRGAALTRGLLAFGRRSGINKQVLSISELVRESAVLLSRTLPKHVVVDTAIESDELRVNGDRGQLQQIIVNLGVNAADAMRDDSRGQLGLTCRATMLDDAPAASLGIRPGRYIELRVTDTGCGIDGEHKRRIFEPFFTTKPIGKGTGLGLATAWGIARSHDGTITVDSVVGEGSTFTVYVPATRKQTQPLSGPTVAALPANGATVLIVDDEEAVRSTTMRALTRRGLKTIGAENGEAALRVMQAHGAAIDLVILDMGMPVMGGRECFARLRELSQVPVLVATGYALEEDARDLVAAGAGLLEKPYAVHQLLAEVARLLAGDR